MRISDFAVRNYPFTIVIFALLIAIGASAWQSIPRTEDPYFPISAFQIVAVYPGADPTELERQVVEPIEDAINTLDDVKEIASSIDDGLAMIRVEFEASVDVDKTYDDVAREIGELRAELPDGLVRLEINKINPGLVNIVQVALVSDSADYRLLEDAAEDLQDRLERVPGVRESETWAYPQRELRVELDFKRLARFNLRAVQVLDAVSADNTNVPGGPVTVGARRFNLHTSGDFETLDEVRATVVGGAPGAIVRVRDVAEVRWDTGPHEHAARFDGERAVFITANQKDGVNIFETQAAIDTVLDRFATALPAGVRLERGFEQSRNVAHRLSRLGADFSIAIVLVAVTLLPLGLRAAGIVMVSVPLSLATGLAVMYFAGFSLNQLSIAGFVVALGLLVDDSIVVVENIARFLRQGHRRDEAAMLATRQISLAVVGCTATLLFAFLPLLALPGNAGKFVLSLPMAVVSTVLASLFVALTIIPFLASRVLPRHSSEEGNALLRTLTRGIHGIYAPLLRRALRRPKTTVALSLALVASSFLLLPVIGFSLFPKADTPQFLVEVTLPDGASVAQTDTVLRQVEAGLAEEPGVAHQLSNLGRGNPQIYYNLFQHEYSASYAEIFVQLNEYDPRETPKLYERLRQRFDRIPGAEIVVKEFENGPPIAAPIAFRVVGPDLSTLRDLATQVEDLMRANPDTRNVRNPQRHTRVDLQLDLDRAKAGLLGVTPIEFDRTVRLALAGLEAGEFREADGDSYPIVLRAPMHEQPGVDALEDLHVRSSSGAQVPLRELAALRLRESPARIERFQRERSVMLTAYTRAGTNTEQVTWDLARELDGIAWPDGYRYVVGGEVESRQESFEGFGTAILVAVFGILAVLVLEFGSFKSTLIVAGVVPLGVMGGLVMLWLSGYSLSFTAMIGFIALTGIEIKNSILLVDFTNQLRARGKGLDDAIAEAGEIRFLPILLTSVTAIGGMIPLATQGAALYSPMALVIIGGLITSTLIGRLVTPVMYKLLPPNIEADARVELAGEV